MNSFSCVIRFLQNTSSNNKWIKNCPGTLHFSISKQSIIEPHDSQYMYIARCIPGYTTHIVHILSINRSGKVCSNRLENTDSPDYQTSGRLAVDACSIWSTFKFLTYLRFMSLTVLFPLPKHDLESNSTNSMIDAWVSPITIMVSCPGAWNLIEGSRNRG